MNWIILRDCRLKGDGVHPPARGESHLAEALAHKAIDQGMKEA
ncbi:hypothetical protein [Streptomyces fungicidicus]